MHEHGTTVTIETLGCKLNQAESEALAWNLHRSGYRVVAPSSGADIYILNTCTVTHIADRKSRHLLRAARRAMPGAFIVAAGCYVQRAPSVLRGMDEVDMAVGNAGKHRLAELLGARRGAADGPPPSFRTRSMVKVQEGCSRWCAYCIVPHVRGAERSLPIDDVVATVRSRVATGYQEVVLTGTHIGTVVPGLTMLVRRVLDESGIARLRLSSLRPEDVTPGLLSLWRDDRLCRHLHIPLQSGSDAVLGRMGRGYHVADFVEAVEMARRAVPDIAITTDIVVGFPGESDEEFEEGYALCRELGLADIHVFPFSERPGTAACGMPGKVAEQVKRDRCRRMRALAEEVSRGFRERFAGRTMTVLWEDEGDGVWQGLTDNYIRVHAHSNAPLANRLTEARLVDGSRAVPIGVG